MRFLPDASAVVWQAVQPYVASEEQQVRALADRAPQQRGAGHISRRLERRDDHVLQHMSRLPPALADAPRSFMPGWGQFFEVGSQELEAAH